MKPQIVYLLGAGFSAPLGIPVMSNFLVKSKDLYFDDPATYEYFKRVFDQIASMSVAKNYYAADLFNIEEILSILEMRLFVDGVRLADEFRQYISATIQAYTPPMTPRARGLPSNWHSFLFGDRTSPWSDYGYFIADILGLKIRPSEGSQEWLTCIADPDPPASYSVITLNYDMVPETVCEYINRHATSGSVGFSDDASGRPLLAKLHGSIEPSTIVPPTWSKGNNPEIVPVWRAALNALREANYIRVIGYSLPTSDAYIRYLLKSAAMDTPHLKGIDIICLDPSGEVRHRYDSFITFADYRFVSASVTEYFEQHRTALFPGRMASAPKRWYGKLEDAHNQVYQARAGS